ncbi:MAG: alanine racemase [candidate division KSB1 bacterium]|nr:alanine racemase [candidate division KSB1 bacterium]MDZ7366832.1 alanine racemase [candidate division KSB1 bacterium]MDZ7405161.1 alanine racemase [candidate division KSB1 bacterium]
MRNNFSSRVQIAIQFSREEALRLGHDYIGTEHILLGILRDGEGIAVEILRNLGADLDKIRRAVEDAVKSTGEATMRGNIPFTKRAEKILKMSYAEAEACKADIIGTEHLLLALIKEKNGVAAQVLRSFGVTDEAIRREIWNILRQSPSKKETSRQGLRLGFHRRFFGWGNKARQAPVFDSDHVGATIGRHGWTQQAADMTGSNEVLRPTVAEIKLGAIADNIRRICQRVQPAEVMAVVKADAYGHGAIPVALTAISAGASQLGVALLEEGLELRRAQIAAPILVFGGFFENQIDSFIANNLQFTLYDLRLAESVSRRAQAVGRNAQAHVKIDTGMGRVGLAPNEAVEAIRAMAKLPNLGLVGLYTHFASSDSHDKSYANQQLEQFQSVVQQVANDDLRFQYLHAANSGAILDLPQSYFNLVRPGVMMYGYYPSNETSESIPLEPAMSLRTRIIFVRRAPAGTFISYGQTFQTRQATTIATLPIGYADGISRRLSNNLEILVRGRRCPLIGRVCMDQIMIDLGDMQDVQAGEEVVLLGKQGDDEISIYEWCRRLETIPYEVTCGVSRRVARVYV